MRGDGGPDFGCIPDLAVSVELTDGEVVEMPVYALIDLLESEGVTMMGQPEAWAVACERAWPGPVKIRRAVEAIKPVSTRN